jgi:hypothetical protein
MLDVDSVSDRTIRGKSYDEPGQARVIIQSPQGFRSPADIVRFYLDGDVDRGPSITRELWVCSHFVRTEEQYYAHKHGISALIWEVS